MAILNNLREIKTWLSEARPQRVAESQVSVLFQHASLGPTAPPHYNPILGASASKPTSTPASAPIHTQHVPKVRTMEPPSRNTHSKFWGDPRPLASINASSSGPAGNASYRSSNEPLRPPSPPVLVVEPADPPLCVSTQVSDSTHVQSDEDLIDTSLLRGPGAESRASRKPATPKTVANHRGPTALVNSPTSTAAVNRPAIADSGYPLSSNTAANHAAPTHSENLPVSHAAVKRPAPTESGATKKKRTASLYSPQALSSTEAQGPDGPNSGCVAKSNHEFVVDSSAPLNPQKRPSSSQIRANSRNKDQAAEPPGLNGQNVTVAVLQEYIRTCEAKIHLLSKYNAVSASTSLSQDAKNLWQTNQFQPRLSQLDLWLARVRPQLTFLEPLPRQEDLSDISGLSSLPTVLGLSQNEFVNILNDFKGDLGSPSSTGRPPVMQVDRGSGQLQHQHNPKSLLVESKPTNVEIWSRSEPEGIPDFQVPNSLPTQNYNSNIEEARHIIMNRRNRVEGASATATANIGDTNESEDDFGVGYMAGLVLSQVDNDDTDLSGFIAPDEPGAHDSESIDGLYMTQPTQFDRIDTDDDEDDLKSLTSGSEAEIDKIRLSQDVAERLGITYEPNDPIEILDDDNSSIGGYENKEPEASRPRLPAYDLDLENENELGENDNGENPGDFTMQLNEGRDEIVEISSEDDLDDIDLDGLKELSFIKSEAPAKLHMISDSDFSDNDDELLQLSKSVGPKAGPISEPFLDEVYQILRVNFRLSEFRSNQLEAIVATLKGKDVFVLIPTGGGKSLCFQLPALVKGGHTRGTTVVVSPLISLMQDQVQHLLSKNIRAGMISSKGTADERNSTFKALTSGQLDLVYLSPEMINNSGRVQKVISKLHENHMLARVVVDEAHCVSSWGHDFRPDYKGMSFFKQNFPEVPIMALTATANEKVRLDIVHNLRMHEPVLLKQSFNRVNLMYEVKNKPPNIYEWIREYIVQKHRGKTGIIYCHSKQSCETTAQKLNDFGVSCMYYHAGMDPTERFDVQEKWQKNHIHVICATIAFGMGIDKPDVRYVIHLYIPRSLEGYYQETGRAGRDGQQSECIMFYSYKDARALQSLIQRDDKLEDSAREAHLTKLQQVVQYCENKTDCRRQQVLHFFNETFDPKLCRKMCDNCCSNVVAVTRDVTDHCVAITKLVQSLQADKVTIIHCQDVYKGARHGKILKQNHHRNPFHGFGKDLDRGDIERIFYHLQSEGGLLEYQVMRGGFATTYVKLGPRANVIMKGTQSIQLSFTEKQPKNKGKTTDARNTGTANKENNGPRNPRLYSSKVPDLSALRYTESFVSARDLNTSIDSGGSFTRISLPQHDFGGQVNDFNSEMINHAFTELRNFRTQKLQELGFGRAHYFISDALLKEMALKLPTNAVDFAKLDAMTKEKVPHFQHFKKLLASLARSRKKATDGLPASSTAAVSNTPAMARRSQKSQGNKASRQKKSSQFRAMPI